MSNIISTNFNKWPSFVEDNTSWINILESLPEGGLERLRGVMGLAKTIIQTIVAEVARFTGEKRAYIPIYYHAEDRIVIRRIDRPHSKPWVGTPEDLLFFYMHATEELYPIPDLHKF